MTHIPVEMLMALKQYVLQIHAGQENRDTRNGERHSHQVHVFWHKKPGQRNLTAEGDQLCLTLRKGWSGKRRLRCDIPTVPPSWHWNFPALRRLSQTSLLFSQVGSFRLWMTAILLTPRILLLAISMENCFGVHRTTGPNSTKLPHLVVCRISCANHSCD